MINTRGPGYTRRNWPRGTKAPPTTLEDGSRVAVIGAGPSGSLFSYFFLSMAEATGLDVDVDIFEPRSFCYRGPAGCNHCGGVVSEFLVQRLATEGISLPKDVVQRGLESYSMHMDVGDVVIRTPLLEKRIATVYRGNGPRDSEKLKTHSFDGYLLELAEKKGARVVRNLVTDMQRRGERMSVHCADQSSGDYDLIVVACGVNSRLLEVLQEESVEFRRPDCTKTFICEFELGRKVVKKTFGPSMHVFLLDIPGLKFAALVPKGDYVTLCLLGKNVDDDLITRFLDSPEVRNCFPDGVVPPPACHCHPRINVRATQPSYADRMVMIGDSGSTRLYKDGLGAAYRTAKAAAKTVVFHGVDAGSFHRHFHPLCRKISNDNQVGKFVFGVAGLIQKARFARRGVLRMTAREQQQGDGPRRMSGVLWDLFSGSSSYTSVLLRTMHPAYVASLVWNLLAGNVQRRGAATNRSHEKEGHHVRH